MPTSVLSCPCSAPPPQRAPKARATHGCCRQWSRRPRDPQARSCRGGNASARAATRATKRRWSSCGRGICCRWLSSERRWGSSTVARRRRRDRPALPPAPRPPQAPTQNRGSSLASRRNDAAAAWRQDQAGENSVISLLSLLLSFLQLRSNQIRSRSEPTLQRRWRLSHPARTSSPTVSILQRLPRLTVCSLRSTVETSAHVGGCQRSVSSTVKQQRVLVDVHACHLDKLRKTAMSTQRRR